MTVINEFLYNKQIKQITILVFFTRAFPFIFHVVSEENHSFAIFLFVKKCILFLRVQIIIGQISIVKNKHKLKMPSLVYYVLIVKHIFQREMKKNIQIIKDIYYVVNSIQMGT